MYGLLARFDVVGDGLALFGGLVVRAANEALDGAHRVLGVGDCLVLRGLADNALAILAEALDGRRSAVAFCVHEDFRLGALHDSHRGVGGAQIDTQNFRHDMFLSFPSGLLLPMFARTKTFCVCDYYKI